MLAGVADVFLTVFLLHYLRQQSLVLVHLPDRKGTDVPPLACFLVRDTARTTRFSDFPFVMLVTNITGHGQVGADALAAATAGA